MGIQSASATLSRFYVPEPVTEDFWGFVDERLRAGSFKECEEGEERSSGFASWDDFFDSSFAYGSYHKGEYLAFNFRQDQRKVSALIKKQYVRQGVQRYRAEHEGKWPSRNERKEIQENIQSWLLDRALPQPSAFDVVWNPAKNWMILGTTSAKMLEVFLEYFENNFRVYPVPLYHAQWALNLIPLDGGQKDFLNSIVKVNSSSAMEEGRFLGHEFLTWLWFFSEESDGILRFSEDRQAELLLGERLVLSLPGEGKERVVLTTQANALHEARTALRQGKLVDEIQLFLRVGDNEYLFTMDSSLWAIKGLRTPKQLPDYNEEDVDGRFLEKMFFWEEVSSVLNSLYREFLSKRLSPSWESDTLPLLREWIERQDDSEHAPKEEAEIPKNTPF